MVGAERVIDEVAFATGKDALDVRKRNFYGTSDRNVTPYHQTVEDNIIHRIVSELEESADYARRRREISAFNNNSRWIKRGLALTPVKFGISFTATHYNQAGALVHVYTDGSVHLNHGGTEMGQGLYVKVAQIVAEEFQIDIGQVKITATTTAKVPNTSATAASSGSDLNGMAAQNAAGQIKQRLVDFAADKYSVPVDQVVFLPNRVRIGNQEIAFADLVKQAYFARVQLSAAGFYKTPKIHWNRDKGEGHPFYYFAYGASCSEVSIDTLTGEYMIERADILHETGRSLNCAIDLGQVEGGFIPGRRLVDDRGTVVGCQGTAEDPRAVHLQDPARLRPAEDIQRDAGRLARGARADDPPLQGGRRATFHAGDVGAACAVGRSGERRRSQDLPPARRPGDAGACADGDRAAEGGSALGCLDVVGQSPARAI